MHHCKVRPFLDLLGKPKVENTAARCNPEESKFSVGGNAKGVICRLGFSLTGDTGGPGEIRRLDLGQNGRTSSVKVGTSSVCEIGIESITS